MKQQFHNGDLVQIAKDLGPHMVHFTADARAIVLYSYHDRYGGNERDKHSYGLDIEGKGRSAWYYGSQLTLIEHGRADLSETWQAERDDEAKLKGNLDWIFSHGEEVLHGAHGATLSTLGKCCGIDEVWGSRGEGVDYYSNALAILHHARPFLERGDKDGWLAYCEEAKGD